MQVWCVHTCKYKNELSSMCSRNDHMRKPSVGQQQRYSRVHPTLQTIAMAMAYPAVYGQQAKGTLMPGQMISVNKYNVQVERFLSQGNVVMATLNK